MSTCTFAESWGRSRSQDAMNVRKYKRTWRAMTDDPSLDAAYVAGQLLAQLGIEPGALITHPSDASTSCIATNVVEDAAGGGIFWDLTADYDVWDTDRYASTPLSIPVEVSVEGQVYQEICDFDVNGNPIVNAAGDPFDPPVMRDRQRQVLRVTQNLGTFPSFAFAYADYLNSATFAGFAAKTVKQSVPQVRRAFHPACGRYYVCDFTFDYRPAVTTPFPNTGWQATALNQGFRQLVGGSQVAITDHNGQNITSPLPLNSSGAVLTPPVTSSDLVMLAWDIYFTVDFNSVYGFGTIP